MCKKLTKRERVHNKSDGLCWYCGIGLVKGWHIDHFEPIRRNLDGTQEHPERDAENNLVPSCRECNLSKGSLPIEGYRKKVQNFIISLDRDVTIYRHAKRYGLIKETPWEVTFWYEENLYRLQRKQANE